MSVSLIRMGPLKMFDERGRAFEFIPEGKVYEVGDASQWYTRDHKRNPVARATKEASQGGRIVVGFNVGIEEKWKMDDIVDIMFDARRQQVLDAIEDGDAQPHPLGGDVGMTFLAQRGIWQAVRDTEAYAENGAQIAIMNIIKEKKTRFRQDMIDLAEILARKLSQQAVILEMSKRGAVTETLEIVP
jgi:hypothetical protein